MARVAQGDVRAFEALALRHTPVLLAVAGRMLGNRADAQDVAQEALLRLWRHAGSWSPAKGNAAGWLMRITVNLCIDRARRARFWPMETPADIADPAAGAEAALLDAEAARRVAEAIAGLPPRQRAAVALFYDAGLSGAEVAAAVGVREGALWSLLRRARVALAAQLADLLV